MHDIYYHLAALGICLLISALGFRKTVWFVSIGYTASIVGLCLATYSYFNVELKLFNLLQIGALLIWGIRLGYFLVKREWNSHYVEAVKSQTDASQGVAWYGKLGIWVSVAILYVIMFAPSLIAVGEVRILEAYTDWFIWTGICIMFLGIGLESIADRQKSQFKKGSPKAFCNTGLYTWVRCPNYLGEILVWVGNYICAVPFYGTWWHWLFSTLGLIFIIIIMVGSAKRLEEKQAARYGDDPEFKGYIKKVPILFPWLPIYSFKKVPVPY